jgi:hypothetical protein
MLPILMSCKRLMLLADENFTTGICGIQAECARRQDTKIINGANLAQSSSSNSPFLKTSGELSTSIWRKEY